MGSTWSVRAAAVGLMSRDPQIGVLRARTRPAGSVVVEVGTKHIQRAPHQGGGAVGEVTCAAALDLVGPAAQSGHVSRLGRTPRQVVEPAGDGGAPEGARAA